MSRTKVVEGGRRDQIIDAANRLFVEHGYDGTSVRSIMREAGGEVGLFYYYFKSKDEVFNTVVERFVDGYIPRIEEMLERDAREPYRMMTDFFEFVERESAAYRAGDGRNLHWTVHMAIREYAQEMLTPYMKRIIESYIAYGLAKPAIDVDVLAMVLMRGVGGIFLADDIDEHSHEDAQIRRAVGLLMGVPPEITGRVAAFAAEEDIEDWLVLAGKVKDAFPGLSGELESGAYRRHLETAIGNREALVLRDCGKLAGVLAFSREGETLDFLAVDPDFRGRRVASRMFQTCAAQFPIGSEITVTTFVEGEPEGKATRAFYHAIGFVDGPEVEAFGHLCQQMTFRVYR